MQLRRAVVLVAAAVLMAGCGIPTPAAPPSAKEVLAKPQQSNLTATHFAVTGKITNNGVTVELGRVRPRDYKPKPAGRFEVTTTDVGHTEGQWEGSPGWSDYGANPVC